MGIKLPEMFDLEKNVPGKNLVPVSVFVLRILNYLLLF